MINQEQMMKLLLDKAEQQKQQIETAMQTMMGNVSQTTAKSSEMVIDDRRENSESTNVVGQLKTSDVDDFAKLPPPTEMPPQIVQRIKDLKCPPPIRPSQMSAEINALNAAMKAQDDAIKLLEDQVDNLEDRYKISFTAEKSPKFDLKPTELPRIDINGTLTNIILDFHLWNAQAGIEGLPGEQGIQGDRGVDALQGPTGISGYYGVRGDMK